MRRSATARDASAGRVLGIGHGMVCGGEPDQSRAARARSIQTPDDLRALIAHHEAGHAIACWHFGIRVTSIRIDASGRGVCNFKMPVDMAERIRTRAPGFERLVEVADTVVVAIFAGYYAGLRYAPDAETPSEHDEALARQLLDAARAVRTYGAREEALRCIAAALVAARWGAIEGLARMLLRDGTVNVEGRAA